MLKISYEKSCNMFFAPLDEIIEALNNDEGICGMSNLELRFIVKNNDILFFYVQNFNTYVI